MPYINNLFVSSEGLEDIVVYHRLVLVLTFSIPCAADTTHLLGVRQRSFPSPVDYFIKAMPQGKPSLVDGHWCVLYKLS